MFWDDEDLMDLGHSIIESLCDFYLGLDKDLQDSVTGITLLNEPAHNMDIDMYESVMTNWLAGAIDIYRKKIVEGGSDDVESVPKLFVNLIGTAMSDQNMLDFFHSTFSPEELQNWAVLDIHHYFAWDGGHNGCYEEVRSSRSDLLNGCHSLQYLTQSFLIVAGLLQLPVLRQCNGGGLVGDSGNHQGRSSGESQVLLRQRDHTAGVVL